MEGSVRALWEAWGRIWFVCTQVCSAICPDSVDSILMGLTDSKVLKGVLCI